MYEREMESLMSTVSNLFITHIGPDKSQDDEAADARPQAAKGKTTQKRSTPPTNMGNEPRKPRRISAGQGMAAMGSEIGTAIDTLKHMIGSTSQRTAHSEARELEARAVKTIENEEGLSDNEFTAATLAVAANPTLANIYLNTQSKSKRTHFLLSNIERFNRGN